VVRVPGYRSEGPGFDSRTLQEKKVVGLERGPLSLVSTIEEVLGRNSSGFGLESREYSRKDSPRWPRGTLYPQKAATNFVDKRRSLGQYSSLADWGHGVFLHTFSFTTVTFYSFHLPYSFSSCNNLSHIYWLCSVATVYATVLPLMVISFVFVTIVIITICIF
jgi:hypothetical protein